MDNLFNLDGVPKKVRPALPTVNWGNQFARNLTLCITPGHERELVNGFPLKYRNSAGIVGTTNGAALDTSAASAVIELVGSEDLELGLDEDITIFTIQKTLSSDASGTIISKRNTSSCNWQFYTDISPSEYNFRVGTSSKISTAVPTHDIIVSTGVTYSTNDAFRVYENGELAYKDIYTISPQSCSSPISIGARWDTYPTPTYDGDFEIAYVLVWYGRTLTLEEMRLLHNDPYQILGSSSKLSTDSIYADLFNEGQIFQPAWARNNNRLIGGM